MALGKRRRERQMEAFVAASDRPRSPGHPFYTALNGLLSENGFDPLVEKLCAPYYAETMGRPGVPPGVFFRMLFVGVRTSQPWAQRSGPAQSGASQPLLAIRRRARPEKQLRPRPANVRFAASRQGLARSPMPSDRELLVVRL